MNCPHGCPWQHQKEHWHYKDMNKIQHFLKESEEKFAEYCRSYFIIAGIENEIKVDLVIVNFTQVFRQSLLGLLGVVEEEIKNIKHKCAACDGAKCGHTLECKFVSSFLALIREGKE